MLKKNKTYLIQALLFIVTFNTTTFSGMDWMGIGEFTMDNYLKGFMFSIPFLGILTVHEFGHYIAARIYRISVTLPYYIPLYVPGVPSIGTLGAFIRIRSPLISKRMVMDVGIAGPLAGFVVALGVLYYGFTHLPAREDIFRIHPSYKEFGLDYEKHVYNYEFSRQQDSLSFEELKKSHSWLIDFMESTGGLQPRWREASFKPEPVYQEMSLGKNLLLLFFEKYVADDPSLVPNRYELFHYPFIFAGFLALFFTALNLLPMGQLDGGHVIFGLVGARRHRIISMVVLITLVYFAGVGVFRNNFIGNAHGSPENLLSFGLIYLYLLYFIFSRISDNWKNNLLIASCVFAAQYFTELLLPQFQGISVVYMVFAGLVGRVLGVGHPPVMVEEPLSLSRKILGWISLIVFILCFTPSLFNIETFYR